MGIDSIGGSGYGCIYIGARAVRKYCMQPPSSRTFRSILLRTQNLFRLNRTSMHAFFQFCRASKSCAQEINGIPFICMCQYTDQEQDQGTEELRVY